MSRPQKIGLEYFPLDTKMDDKLELIEAKYDLIGYAIIIKLWSKIYHHSYWYKWTEKEILLFKKQNNIDINLLKNIVNDGLEWGIFDLAMYKKHQILTSSGIQKRYLFAIKNRINQEFVFEYCIFDVYEYVNSVKDKVNVVKVELNPHIILKDIISNDIKGKEPVKPKIDLPQFAIEISQLIFTNSGITPTKNQINAGAIIVNDINRIDGYDPAEIEQVIKWALSDEFWCSVLQSPASLRKKRNGSSDLTKFQKIYHQWKAKSKIKDKQSISAVDDIKRHLL